MTDDEDPDWAKFWESYDRWMEAEKQQRLRQVRHVQEIHGYFLTGTSPKSRDFKGYTHDEWMTIAGNSSWFDLRPGTRLSKLMFKLKLSWLYFAVVNFRHRLRGYKKRWRRKREKIKGMQPRYYTYDEWIQKEIK